MRSLHFSKSMLRDAVLVAGLAIVTVLALRRWVGDRYLVPTGSMEPLLHGDPKGGDIVFVDKRADRRRLRVGDLVVVKHPGEPGQQMVKRIAASGDDVDCCIGIDQGDVWRGPDPQRMERERKDPLAARSRQVPWALGDGPSAQRDRLAMTVAVAGDGGWQLPAATGRADTLRASFRLEANHARHAANKPLEGHVGTSRAVDAGFLDRAGAVRDIGSDHRVHDCSLAMHVVRGVGDVLATVDRAEAAFTFHWQPATGRVVLWCNGEDLAATTLPGGVSVAHDVEFGFLDDRLYFCVDADPARLWLVERTATWPKRATVARTQLWLAVVDGNDGAKADFAFDRIAVHHDVFAYREPIAGLRGQPGSWPRRVPAGHWFLLGDSAFDSRDSRHFGEVPMASFLGVPCCVLGPWPRLRWVTP
jgi:hypothetical protein